MLDRALELKLYQRITLFFRYSLTLRQKRTQMTCPGGRGKLVMITPFAIAVANVQQMKSAGKRTVFVGDDTWDALYPDAFTDKFPYPSFNVKVAQQPTHLATTPGHHHCSFKRRMWWLCNAMTGFGYRRPGCRPSAAWACLSANTPLQSNNRAFSRRGSCWPYLWSEQHRNATKAGGNR